MRFVRGCLGYRLNTRAGDLMKTDRENQRRSPSKVTVLYYEQGYGTLFLREHSSPNTSSIVVRVQVVGVCEVRTLAGMPGPAGA